MKQLLILLFSIILLQSCQEQPEISSISAVNWDKRTVKYALSDSMVQGSTYLSVYSQIYSQTEHKTHNLTATVSMRNTDQQDTVFVESARYFDTQGRPIRSYFENTIYIAPMETVEIVIDETDEAGGTGANFLFKWKMRPGTNEPLFEGVMISTSGQQGLSFLTQGQRLR